MGLPAPVDLGPKTLCVAVGAWPRNRDRNPVDVPGDVFAGGVHNGGEGAARAFHRGLFREFRIQAIDLQAGHQIAVPEQDRVLEDGDVRQMLPKMTFMRLPAGQELPGAKARCDHPIRHRSCPRPRSACCGSAVSP